MIFKIEEAKKGHAHESNHMTTLPSAVNPPTENSLWRFVQFTSIERANDAPQCTMRS